ncbi:MULTISPECIES: EAL domain-containing protein [unclassified Cyanobium]|uniref:putative bifunctional diguanylate cyclase/phosphodiesterase n=1 Tax=unclassified Cyanobium TaxID=2627006 RepID=UPI0020CD2422|nr:MULTISPECIES: EAL domain-containing protein [unclassified Cyanobium]MCP9833014.1 EAL domain-containing protein [Cyanobium sp. La Preciosa 7G6]MCP9935764.1 EAL domain-containing protein [Cyanobium sp. Aljojuca 7A6]
MAIGLLGTILLAWNSYTQASKEHDLREEPTADLVRNALLRKLASTESVLRSLAGLELASEAVTLSELERFVGSVANDGRSLDGIGTMGYATAESGKAPIRLIAPLDASNRRLLGSDLWSQVLDPGQGLRQDSAPSQGWLLPGRSGPGQPTFLVQILAFGGSPTAAGPGPTPPTRWAFATLPLRDLLRAALHHPLIQLKEPVILQLYSGERANPNQLLYDSRNLPRAGVLPHAKSRLLETGGQRWLLLVQTPLQVSGPWLPTWGAVLLLGLATSVLAGLLSQQVLKGSQAIEREERNLGAMRRNWEASLEWFHLFRQAFSLIQEGVVITDSTGSILTCNEAYSAITGYALEALVGRNPRMMKSGYQGTAFYAALWEQLRASDRWQGEIWNRRSSGEIYPAWMQMGVVRDASGAPSHFVAALADLTSLQEKDRQLEYLGYHDPLTRLPNLQMAELRLGQLCQQTQPLALIWIELDGLKRIEESFGQAKGDQLLQVIVERLGRFVGPTDVLAQVGRSEFLIVHSLDPADPTGLQLAHHIVGGLSDPMAPVETLEQALSAWAGVSCFPKDSREPETLLLFAATALGQARRLGPQAILPYTAEMTIRSRHRLAIEAHLKRAVEADQLELFYQPQVDGQGTLLGAEALLRWRSPKFGLVSPLEFLPIAEASDLIHRIGAWVLEDACRQWQAWVQAGLTPGRLAVNLSNRQFQDPKQSVPQLVAACLARTCLEAHWLELEITESCLMPALGTREQLLELEAMGVELAIDDFGTGFSSLSTIHRYPISKLKIDRSFVDGVDTNPTSQSIVRATLAMARGLGVNTLAEGVERPEELDFLLRCGCPAFQGYLFNRPLAAAQFEALLQKGAAAGPAPGGEPARVHHS